MSRLSVDGLTKVFPNGVKALDGFTLEMAENEFLAVVGPSGCGKSTLLRMIAGLEPETSGRVLLDGKPLNGLAPRDRDMAVMFQNHALFPHLTVAENMAFGLRLRKVPAVERRSRVEAMSATLGIGELLARYPSELSGGQRQRAALGRAILRKPKIFLFDEPLSNLDAQMRAQMRVEISRLHQGIESSMLFVTHDQVEALTMGDRVVVLKDGVIQQVADPATLYARPANAFVASFIGSPGMNLFPGRIEGDDFVSEALTVRLSPEWKAKLEPGRKVLLGLRPEDIGSAEARGTGDAPLLKGNVGVVERLGGQVCLYVTPPSSPAGLAFAARPAEGRPGDGEWHAGRNVELPVFLPKALYFDSATGIAL